MTAYLPLIDSSLVQHWLREAGEIALSSRDISDFMFKSDKTIVTAVDRHIEEFLIDKIRLYYPMQQIIAEEGGDYGEKGEFLWVIDPIDGTRAFASGLPIWGISIGVLRYGIPYAGWLYMPMTQQMYWGSANGAFYNNKPLKYNSNIDIQNPLAFLAVPSNAHLLYEISFPRLRSLGSTTAHLAFVAHGIATAALIRRVQIWDIAALLPILLAVGIELNYLSGKSFQIYDLIDGRPSPEPIVAASINIMEDIRGRIRLKISD